MGRTAMTKQESCAQIDVENQRTILDKHLYMDNKNIRHTHTLFNKTIN